MTEYIVVWRRITPVGPQRDMTRCLTWARALDYIKALEAAGITVTDVAFV